LKPGKISAPLAGKKSVRKRPRIHDELLDAIAASIVSGAYPAGLPLPRESELCKMHGVSRTAVREALKVLESKNLVLCRPRVGTIVFDREAWNILDARVIAWLGPTLKGTDLLAAIFEVRHTIEPAAAAAASQRASLEDIAKLEKAWRKMAGAGNDAALFFEGDLAFHEALLAASGNKIFVRLGAVIESAVNFVLRTSSQSVEDLADSVEQHGKLVEALRMRDKVGAEAAAHQIIKQGEGDIATALAGS
jgi:GntR family transcriptional regulator, galactonate operon transcriptional repressor